MTKGILIAGEICSGKDTFYNKHFSEDKFVQIDLGSLVREKFQTADRIFDNTLEPYFIMRIKEMIKNSPDSIFVITGIRQPTLCVKIANLFDEIEYNYLTVPRNILKERYKNRADVKDANITFEDAMKGDQSLGMKDLQIHLLTEVECNFIKNY